MDEKAARDRATKFLIDLEKLCVEHGFALDHEDPHGRFILRSVEEKHEAGVNGAFAVWIGDDSIYL